MDNAAIYEISLRLTQWDFARTTGMIETNKLIYSSADAAEARQVFEALLEELNAAYVPLRSKFDVSLVLTAGAETLDSIELASTLFYAEAEGHYNQCLKTIAEAMGPG
jgi:hypothetical protein